MNPRDVPPPPEVEAYCKLDPRGFPITYVTKVGADGVPDFRQVDYVKMLHCMRHRLCGICGQKLGRRFCLIGSDETVTERVYSDPAMHRSCAKYALAVCPFLSGHGKRRPIDPAALPPDEIIIENPLGGTERPDRIALVTASGYELVSVAAAAAAAAAGDPGGGAIPAVPGLRVPAGFTLSVEWLA